jgi:hypothetical protein
MNLPEHSSEKSGFVIVQALDSGMLIYGRFYPGSWEYVFEHDPEKAEIHPTRERAQEDIDLRLSDDEHVDQIQIVQIKKEVSILLWND